MAWWVQENQDPSAGERLRLALTVLTLSLPPRAPRDRRARRDPDVLGVAVPGVQIIEMPAYDRAGYGPQESLPRKQARELYRERRAGQRLVDARLQRRRADMGFDV